MENFLASDLPGKIIQTLGAIIVAIITKWGLARTSEKNRGEPAVESEQPRPPRDHIWWILCGLVAAVTFSITGLAYDRLTPKPRVEITTPGAGESIEVRLAPTGSGSFPIEGNSARIIGNPGVRAYMLVHPADPFGEGWWIQPAVVMNSDGSWSGQAWIGAPDSPPKAGDLIDIMAVVTEPEHVRGHSKTNDPKDIDPLAQSATVRISIGSTR